MTHAANAGAYQRPGWTDKLRAARLAAILLRTDAEAFLQSPPSGAGQGKGTFAQNKDKARGGEDESERSEGEGGDQEKGVGCSQGQIETHGRSQTQAELEDVGARKPTQVTLGGAFEAWLGNCFRDVFRAVTPTSRC